MLSVSFIETNVLRDCVWLVLFAWNDSGQSHQAWSEFSFPSQRQEDGCHFPHLFAVLCTFSSKSHWKMVTKAYVNQSSENVQDYPVSNAGRVMTILSHPYLSVASFCAGSLEFSVKHGFISVLLLYRFFCWMCVCGKLGLSVVRVRVQAV